MTNGELQVDGKLEQSPVISAIIPAYNEAAGLGRSLARLRAALSNLDVPFEIIVVDDGSRDETWKVLKSEMTNHKQLRGVRLSRNFGKENAICAGLDMARGQAVVVLDADLQHPPEIIPSMVSKWRQGFKIVEGFKKSRGRESLLSRWGAWLFYFLLGSISRFKLQGASDFKLLDRSVVTAWKSLNERNVFFRGMTEWIGFERAVVEFEVGERIAGVSAWSRLQLLSLALRAITSYSSFPLRLVTIMGLVFMGLAALLALQTIYQKLAGQALGGFATVNLLILITGSCLMLALGAVGEYLARIYDEVKGRPRYIVSDRLGNAQAAVQGEEVPGQEG